MNQLQTVGAVSKNLGVSSRTLRYYEQIGVIEIFERNISELDEQITALVTVKSILGNLVTELHEKANMRL